MNSSFESRLLPLNRLKKSPRNVRQTPHTKQHIEALARNIDAYGQIHEMTVETERADDGQPTGYYLVTAGEGRRLAQLLRVKWKRIVEDALMRCQVNDDASPRGISLSENELCASMHPADQFVAFKQLIDDGSTIEDVAAQFSVTPSVVQRRLKLANVAPDFISLYRDGKVTMEQLMAFAITEDHSRQCEVWKELPPNRRTPEDIRAAVTLQEVPITDPLARFVTLKAYEKAGGPVRRDLFSDEDDIYLVDRALVERIAKDKLDRRAAAVKKEGFAWVEVDLSMDCSKRATYGRVRTISREPTEEEADRLRRGQERLDAIEKEIEGTGDEETLTLLHAEREALDDQIEAVEDSLCVSHPDDLAVAGAIISIGSDGKVIVDRNRIRPEDRRRAITAAADGRGETDKQPRTHSAALTRRLTVYRTVALQAALVKQPNTAVVALVHALVLRTFYAPGARGGSSLRVDLEPPELERDADDVVQTRAHADMREQYDRLRSSLPDAEALFGWLMEQTEETRKELIAYCVARCLNGVQSDDRRSPFDEVAKAANLDMRDWWIPTADGYFASLPKWRILEAVGQAAPPETVRAMALLKKGSLAKSAEEKLSGSGWLPALLRAHVA
ncbi:ParB/RepB/Spo0J family partition protein [Steroidobacter agaridevorans]|uniref:ParB/RepB/Spo0J family partition protein n=1 Tax=Steroidobacter agaridevorans TaxID=2695856 RepID=UPI001327E215|nr:ParB N-terminal domain-containing protein [Steroidobacter agaridevorans]GFE87804.1 DNA-binding protein [Steroidobacter agaridevorans]